MNQPVEPVYLQLVHLRRRFPVQARRVRGFVDAAPLVDVVLVLFLFFLVQSSFVLQPGVRVNLPSASAFADGATYGNPMVTMAQEGMIFFDDERTTLEGLEASFRRAVYENPEAVLLVAADGGVRHETLMRVYHMAREAGIVDVVLAARPEAKVSEEAR